MFGIKGLGFVGFPNSGASTSTAGSLYYTFLLFGFATDTSGCIFEATLWGLLGDQVSLSGFINQMSSSWVDGLGFRVSGLGFRV